MFVRRELRQAVFAKLLPPLRPVLRSLALGPGLGEQPAEFEDRRQRHIEADVDDHCPRRLRRVGRILQKRRPLLSLLRVLLERRRLPQLLKLLACLLKRHPDHDRLRLPVALVECLRHLLDPEHGLTSFLAVRRRRSGSRIAQGLSELLPCRPSPSRLERKVGFPHQSLQRSIVLFCPSLEPFLEPPKHRVTERLDVSCTSTACRRDLLFELSVEIRARRTKQRTQSLLNKLVGANTFA